MATRRRYQNVLITVWERRTYDVWGNARDGWQVNDTYNDGEVVIDAPVSIYSRGTDAEFANAYPTDRQIRDAFGLGRTHIDLDGDDQVIYVNRRRDGFPLGELRLVSPESLTVKPL